jgi:hypothetical protein
MPNEMLWSDKTTREVIHGFFDSRKTTDAITKIVLLAKTDGKISLVFKVTAPPFGARQSSLTRK